MSLASTIILGVKIALLIPLTALALLGVMLLWAAVQIVFGFSIFWWVIPLQNFLMWLRRLPGRGFIRATHEWQAFTVNYIRPAFYNSLYSLKEGKLNTWAHDFIRTPKKTCDICYEDTFRHRFHKLSSCGHTACVYCIREYVAAQIDTGHSEFICPLGEECGKVTERVVHKVTRLDWELRDRVENMYIRVGLAACVDNFRCPTTECGNAVFSDERLEEELYRKPSSLFRLRTAFETDFTGSDLRKFKCENCGYSYCVLCSRVWDQGMRRTKLCFRGFSAFDPCYSLH